MSNAIYGQNADITLLRQINLHRNRSLDGTFIFITNAADPVSIGVPVVTMAAGLKTHDTALFRKGCYMGASWLGSIIISTTLKQTIRRDRPFVTYPDIEKLAPAGSPSFPSGHTTEAFSTATALSLSFPKWYVIAPAYVWAGLVGYSRMDLGVHYPSDVLAGMVIGTGTTWLCYKGQKWLAHRKKSKNSYPEK